MENLKKKKFISNVIFFKFEMGIKRYSFSNPFFLYYADGVINNNHQIQITIRINNSVGTNNLNRKKDRFRLFDMSSLSYS